MNKDIKSEALQEMLQMVKKDYNFSVKLWVWAKVVKEWAGIIVGSAIFFLVALFIVISVKKAEPKIESQPIETIQGIEETNKIQMKQMLTDHLEEIAEFLKANSESVNNRQEIIEKLTSEISSYAGHTLTQAQLENKAKRFSSLLSTCNHYRGNYMNRFAKHMNPFEDPSVSRAFDELVVGHFFIGQHILDPREENKRWESLCTFCQQEAIKANEALVQLLKTEGDIQKQLRKLW